MCQTCSPATSKVLTNDISDEIVEASSLFSMQIVQEHYGEEYASMRSTYSNFIFRLFAGRYHSTPDEELQQIHEKFLSQWKNLHGRAQRLMQTGVAEASPQEEVTSENPGKPGLSLSDASVSVLKEKKFYVDTSKMFMNPDKVQFHWHAEASEPEEGQEEAFPEEDEPCQTCDHGWGSHTSGFSGPCIVDECGCEGFEWALHQIKADDF